MTIIKRFFHLTKYIHDGSVGCYVDIVCARKKGGVGLALMCLFAAPLVLAEGSAESGAVATELPIEVQQKLTDYQQCVGSVMGAFEPAAIKRQQIVDSCQQYKDIVINSYPEEVQVYVDAAISNRLELVLSTLEQSEQALLESAEDASDVAQQFEALSEQVSNEATE